MLLNIRVGKEVRTISADINDILAQYRTQINKRLETLFDKKIEEASRISNYTQEIVAEIGRAHV